MPGVDSYERRASVMRSDVYVVATAEERFAILQPDKLPAGPLYWSSIEEWRQLFDRWLLAGELLREEDVQARLADMGMSKGEVHEQLQRARRLRTFNQQTTGDRPTNVGYRNGQRQTVVRRTEATGSIPGQRVFVMRCDDCGREYGTNGCDIPSRRCPHCQSGSPGLPTSAILES